MARGRVYTGSGDGGETGLAGGERVRKDSVRPEAYGSVDELCSWLGLIVAELEDPAFKKELQRIQGCLMQAGARLACTVSVAEARDTRGPGEAEVAALEAAIDRMLDELPKRTSFVLPGGCRVAAMANVARTVCRRAERRVVTLQGAVDEADLASVQVYLNRLSDYLYALARTCNHRADCPDIPWERL